MFIGGTDQQIGFFRKEWRALLPWEKRIEEILDAAPTRAMSFSRLMKAVRAQSPGPVGDPEQILNRMNEEPTRFLVVPDPIGPWAEAVQPSRVRAPRPNGEGKGDPWVLARTPPRPASGSEELMVIQVQESLRAWGQELDTRSQGAIARWIDANCEAEEVMLSLFGPEIRGR
jgi:hypothetical protein